MALNGEPKLLHFSPHLMNEAGVEAGSGSGSKERRKIHLEKMQVSLMSERCFAGNNTYCRDFVG